MGKEQPSASAEEPRSPSSTPLNPTAGTAVYENDLIMKEVCFWLYNPGKQLRADVRLRTQRDLNSMLLVDRRGFVMAARAKYKDISCNILEKLNAVECAFNRLQIYLQAVKSYSFPGSVIKMPGDIDIQEVRRQYPNLRYIRFALPYCHSYSTLRLYDESSSTGVNNHKMDSSTGDIVGEVELVLHSNQARELNMFDEKMGVHGPNAKFHLTGLVLAAQHLLAYQPRAAHTSGCRYTGDGTFFPWEAARKDYWPGLCRHLRSLAVCSGGSVEQLAGLANSAPGLQSLSLNFKADPVAYEEDDSDSKFNFQGLHAIDDGAGVIKSFLEQYRAPPSGLRFIALTVSGLAGLHHLADISAANIAPHSHWGWSVGDLEPVSGKRAPVEEWRRGLKRISWAMEAESVCVTGDHEAEFNNPMLMGILLHALLRPSLCIQFVHHWTRAYDTTHAAWCKNVRQTRLYLIEQDRKFQPRGYRLLLEAGSRGGEGSVNANADSVVSPVQAMVEGWNALSEEEKAEFAARTCLKI